MGGLLCMLRIIAHGGLKLLDLCAVLVRNEIEMPSCRSTVEAYLLLKEISNLPHVYPVLYEVSLSRGVCRSCEEEGKGELKRSTYVLTRISSWGFITPTPSS